MRPSMSYAMVADRWEKPSDGYKAGCQRREVKHRRVIAQVDPPNCTLPGDEDRQEKDGPRSARRQRPHHPETACAAAAPTPVPCVFQKLIVPYTRVDRVEQKTAKDGSHKGGPEEQSDHPERPLPQLEGRSEDQQERRNIDELNRVMIEPRSRCECDAGVKRSLRKIRYVIDEMSDRILIDPVISVVRFGCWPEQCPGNDDVYKHEGDHDGQPHPAAPFPSCPVDPWDKSFEAVLALTLSHTVVPSVMISDQRVGYALGHRHRALGCHVTFRHE